jgi:hypothetical protein
MSATERDPRAREMEKRLSALLILEASQPNGTSSSGFGVENTSLGFDDRSYRAVVLDGRAPRKRGALFASQGDANYPQQAEVSAVE